MRVRFDILHRLGVKQCLRVERVRAGPGTPESVEVGFRLPLALGQRDAVVVEQRPLPVLQIGDGLRVGDQRAVVGDLGRGVAGDRPQVLLDRFRATVDLQLENARSLSGGGSPIEVRFCRLIFLGQFLVRIGQFVGDLVLLGTEHLASLGQPQLEILHLSSRGTQAERHFQHSSGRPARVIVVRNRAVKAAEGTVVVFDEVVAKAGQRIRSHQIEPWPHKPLGRQ